MIKQLIKTNQTLSLYFLTHIIIITYVLSLFFVKIFGAKNLQCDRGFISGIHTCNNISEYFFENAFWVIYGIVILQAILIPAAFITHYSNQLIRKNIKTKYKERLWFKYVLAICLYLISISLVIRIIESF